jgi:phosphodiesterase/alkaline phosphatase D-like protein
MSQGMNRRTFVSQVGLASASWYGWYAWQSGTAAMAADELPASPPGTGLRVALLEHPDPWTKQSTGAATLLQRCGASVIPLDLACGPSEQSQPIDLLVFGSFVNNTPDYKKYVNAFAEEIVAFVREGGVVLEMTQSDQFGDKVEYLPEPLLARRCDDDFDDVYVIASEHPLTSWIPADAGKVGKSHFERSRANWESFCDWRGLQVLLASRPNADFPCLLLGESGQGRWILTSLWLDKCFDSQDQPTFSKPAIEVSLQFFAAVAAYVQLVKAGQGPPVVSTLSPALIGTGPLVGHVDTQTARLWYRPAPAHNVHRQWLCELRHERQPPVVGQALIDGDHDDTLHFEVSGLKPDTEYQYRIFPVGETSDWSVEQNSHGQLRTLWVPAALPEEVVLGLGSCAPSTPDHIWTRVLQEGCQGFVFLGDTPYIDSDQLSVARTKHRDFLRQPEIAAMIRQIPCWGTWDDHDFGINDGHGDFSGKHVARIAFCEYRANRTFGHDAEGNEQPRPFGEGRGIHTSFRFGPLEVFLLDPRWFSRTGPSWADPAQTTCLGRHQWEWLKEKLRDSTATFKAITTGMIWDDKKNSEKDDWETYSYEREAIFDFIRDQRIPGCFLIGGDIHVSRALNYGDRVGYPLWQFIISPMHGSTISSLNVPHPALVHSAVEPHVFLRLGVNHKELQARWINRDGRQIFSVVLAADELNPGLRFSDG